MEAEGSLSALLRLTRLFRAHDLPYMVVGAHAVMVHGIPRFTGDLDIVLHLPYSEMGRVESLLRQEGCSEVEERRDEFGRRLAAVTPEDLVAEVFFAPGDAVHDREFERRVPVTVRGKQVWFLSAEDLVLRKLVNCRVRRGQDFDDAVAVLATQGDRLDLGYLRQHCGVHRVCGLLDQAMDAARSLAS